MAGVEGAGGADSDGGLLGRTESYMAATSDATPTTGAAAAAALPAADTVVDVVRKGKLDTLVTVVDAESFLHHFESTARVGENDEFCRVENASSQDLRHIVDLLIDQVEVADVIVLNKVDLVEPEQLTKLAAIIGQLNPHAKLIECQFGRVKISELLQTNRYSERKAEDKGTMFGATDGSDKFKSTLSGQAGVGSFMWRSRRPFHPIRLHNMICTWKNDTLLRSKGFICVSGVGKPSALGGHEQLYWALAGKHLRLHNGRECVAHSANNFAAPLHPCHYHDGCRHDEGHAAASEIVFIGIQVNKEEIEATLNAALCTDDELKADKPFDEVAVKALPKEPWKAAEAEEVRIREKWAKIAVVLAVLTIVWNIAEGVVSIKLGLEAEAFSVVSFGGDSLIEVLSAFFVLGRIVAERRTDIVENKVDKQRRERIATIAIGVLLCALALGTVVGGSIRLKKKEAPDDTVLGIVISSISISFMFFLWWAKVKASVILDSRTMEADAACSFGCISLSVVLLIGSAIYQGSSKLWWVDPSASLILAVLILWEGVQMIRAASRADFDGCGCTHEASWASKYLRKKMMTAGGTLKEAIVRANALTSDKTYSQNGGYPYSEACAQLCECYPCDTTCCPINFKESRVPTVAAIADLDCDMDCCTDEPPASPAVTSSACTKGCCDDISPAGVAALAAADSACIKGCCDDTSPAAATSSATSSACTTGCCDDTSPAPAASAATADPTCTTGCCDSSSPVAACETPQEAVSVVVNLEMEVEEAD